MQLARIGKAGQEIPAASLDRDRWFDVRSIAPDIDAATIAARIPDIRAALETGGLPELDGGRFGAPLTGVGKVLCVGHNYRAHVIEAGRAMPVEPSTFLKTPDIIVGATDEIRIPIGSTRTDWEIELGVVIGSQARYLASEEQALACIAGYVLADDVSEREFQLDRGGSWDKGKNCETFLPLGPWIRTADELPDPQNVNLRLSVDGVERQNANTGDMIFSVAYIVWYLSQFCVLRPGDVLITGTPSGVASGRPDKPFLRAGQLVEAESEGFGRMANPVVDAVA